MQKVHVEDRGVIDKHSAIMLIMLYHAIKRAAIMNNGGPF